jgi:hypothetical protein
VSMAEPKVAIVGPAFFGYLRRVAEMMTARGIPARFYDEFPSNRILTKIALRYSNLAVRQRLTRSYHEAVTDEIIASGATHVLFGTIEMFPHACVRRLRDHKIIMARYAWDSSANKPYARTLDPYMRAVASFDPEDCRRDGYRYVPLFSSLSAPAENVAPDLDFFYCATFHSNRPKLVGKLIEACEQAHWSLKLMLFFHSRWLWYMRFAAQPMVWRLGRSLATKPFSLHAISAATARARVVIDIHHGGQSGLTMRTFEALSVGTVVLTTNPMALVGLPNPLHERVVVFDPINVMGSMAEALKRPRGALSAEWQYYLSSDRFLDQIIDLLLGK